MPDTATCTDHSAKSTDFVALNSKEHPVYRCNGSKTVPPKMPHYFTVETVEPTPIKKPRKKAAV